MEAKNLKVAMNAGIDATRRFLAPHYLVWVNLVRINNHDR